MGTDIHMFAEIHNGNGWTLAMLPYWSSWWAEGRKYHKGYKGYSDRNYSLFGMLADVRNGSGFAGVDLGDGFMPVLGCEEPCRGLPDDMSSELQRRTTLEWEDEEGNENEDHLWLGDHSFSWLTAQEIIDYFEVERVTKRRGVVGAVQYLHFISSGKPSSWSGDVSGKLVRHISNEGMLKQTYSIRTAQQLRDDEADAIAASKDTQRVASGWSEHDLKRAAGYREAGEKIAAALGINYDDLTPVPGDQRNWQALRYYTKIEWEESYRDCVFNFLDWFAEVLQPLVHEHGAGNVRIVFGFDS
jgi:hypothetical protein